MRFCFIAGAGAGKSTTAAWLFSEMKKGGYSVELVNEYVKAWVYLDRKPRSFDQVYIFGKQLQLEDRVLTAGVKNIVTDSPIILASVYARLTGLSNEIAQALEAIALEFEKKHPARYIYLAREGQGYSPEGRWQTYEEAQKVDEAIQGAVTTYLSKNGLPSMVTTTWSNSKFIRDLAFESASSG